MFLWAMVVQGQSVLDFEAGGVEGWTQYPADRWEVALDDRLEGLRCLHHSYDGEESSRDRIAYHYPLELEEGVFCWRFLVSYDRDPSGSNNWGFFLGADLGAREMHPSGSVSGYVVGVNYSGSDDLLKLWRVNGGSGYELIAGTFNWQDRVSPGAPVGIEVLWQARGQWVLKVDTTGGFSCLEEVGRSAAEPVLRQEHIGIYYEYTSTADRCLWVDAIYMGPPPNDTEAPRVSGHRVEDARLLEVRFNEPMDSVSLLSPASYIFDPGGMKVAEVLARPPFHIVRLRTVAPLPAGHPCRLRLTGLSDRTGNPLRDTTLTFTHAPVEAYDVVISELMADPEPTTGLPEGEYLELYNTLAWQVDLTGWRLTFSGETVELGQVKMAPRSWLIVCSQAHSPAFGQYGPVYGVEKMPAINNNGEWIMLQDEDGAVISFVDYSEQWYGDDYKRAGGWSMEQEDPFNPCGGKDNWQASRAQEGGTPGRANSVAADNPDWQGPHLVYAGMPDSCTLLLHFNEPLHARTTCRPHHYRLQQPGPPDSVFFIQPGMQALQLDFSQPFRAGIPYRLSLGDSLTDCAGNRFAGTAGLELERPLMPRPGDWLINEVLFNPRPGGSDYVELYNASDHFLDLGHLCIQGGRPGNSRTVRVSPYSRLVPPHTYVLLTEKPAVVKQQYQVRYPRRLVALTDLPGLPDEAGKVVLMDRGLQVVDHMKYSGDMHFPLLSGSEGVALERIGFGGSSQDPSMWHSASQPSGYGTPTYQNSQFTLAGKTSAPFSISPDVFSPDNDGRDDLLNIHYRFDQPGHVATLRIYDACGRLVRLLVNNQAVGTKGTFVWDGLDGNHRQVRMGIYVVDVRVYRLNGSVRHYRFACVVGGML